MIQRYIVNEQKSKKKGMKIMNKKKLVTMLTAMGLVGVVAIGGTLAWLTASTEPVKNTFAMSDDYFNEDGEIKLNLFEYQVRRDANEEFNTVMDGDNKVRTEDGTTYHTVQENTTSWSEEGIEGVEYTQVLPGSVLPKEPTVELAADSPLSRIYIQVTGIDSLENIATVSGYSENWVKVDPTTGDTATTQTGDGIYLYVGDLSLGNLEGSIVDGGIGVTTPALFTTVTVAPEITSKLVEGAEVWVDAAGNEYTKAEFDAAFNSIDIDAAVIQSTNINDLATSIDGLVWN